MLVGLHPKPCTSEDLGQALVLHSISMSLENEVDKSVPRRDPGTRAERVAGI